MQTPELLLSGINRALRELRGAARVLKDERIDAELLPVMRSLLLAQIVGQEWTVAVGGSQGAGKTTLVRTMYGLSGEDAEWLNPNEGQGEKLPVLIQEDAEHERPQGYVFVLRPCAAAPEHVELSCLDVSVEEFAHACRGARPEVLLPVLKVPRKFFRHNGQSLILLPGYEPLQRENKVWQALMRQVLIAAAGCVIVTDQTRLANRQELDIVQDMLSSELRASRPLVVVSKTEGLANDPQRLQEVQRSAASVFQLTGELAQRQVICAGSDDPDYVAQWLPQLRAALHDMSIGGGETRQMQLTRLETTLDRDLNRALNLIHSRATLFFQQTEGASTGPRVVVNTCLEAFDVASSELREDYRKSVQGILDAHTGQAVKNMNQRLIDKHEGLGNKLVNVFDTVSETQHRIESDVAESWSEAGNLLSKYTQALDGLTNKLLERSRTPDVLSIPSGQAHLLQRLGYVDAKGDAVASKLTNQGVQTDLEVLLGTRKTSSGEVQARSTTDLEKTTRLLPVMALEYARVASALPEMMGVNATTLAPLPQMDVVGSTQKVQQQFEQFSAVSKTLLKGLGVMLAVDIADGQLDTIPALLTALGLGGGAQAATTTATAAGGAAGGTAATVASTVASSVAGVVAIGFLVHSALQEVRRHDGEVRSLAHAMLLNSKDHHLTHFISHFNDLMSKLRSHLLQSLRRRYALDHRLMEQDRLAKALADVHVLQRELLDELTRSGQTLQLFGGAKAA